MGSEAMAELPVIDFSKLEELKSGASNSWRLSTCNEVQRALEDHGCFVAACGKGTVELHNAMLELVRQLFDLPEETKLQKYFEDKGAFGYDKPRPSMPLYEGFAIDNGTNPEGVQCFTNLIWPDGHDGFRETCLSYGSQTLQLEQLVVKMALESYGVEKHYEAVVGSMNHQIVLIKYRPPTGSDSSNAGHIAHRDKSFLTIIDSNHVKGLEIETKSGDQWIRFEPASSHLVVLAGEAFVAWSNGRVHAAKHRVIIDYGNTDSRFSMLTFALIKEVIQAPEELIDEQHPLRFRPYYHRDYLQYCAEQLNQNKYDKCSIKGFCGV